MLASADSHPSDLPLRGIRVTDFSRILAGPYATMMLGDLGAEVVKVERPGTGDDTRTWGPPFLGDDAVYFLSVNRNKSSVVIDLASPEGQREARRLVAGSDVVVENFRSGVMERFGLGYADLAEQFPRLIYCSIPAYTHPDVGNAGGYDLIMQAAAGHMSFTGEPGRVPVKMGVALLDVVAGLHAAVAILAALRARDVTGQGRRVTVGLFESSVAALVNQAANYLIGGQVPEPHGSGHPNIVPYQAFPTADGDLVVAVGNDSLFGAACEALERPDLAVDPRYLTNADRVTHRRQLVAELEEEFRKRSASEWLARLDKVGVPASPVRDLAAVFSSPEGRAMVAEVPTDGGPMPMVRNPIEGIGMNPHQYRPPPRLGEAPIGH